MKDYYRQSERIMGWAPFNTSQIPALQFWRCVFGYADPTWELNAKLKAICVNQGCDGLIGNQDPRVIDIANHAAGFVHLSDSN
ncbi:MAG: hypothetical protein KDN22_27730 [Verrucomicrobiae bacterium]|nr:hypothetical protein [Verrucomicrobiae bacterium]